MRRGADVTSRVQNNPIFKLRYVQFILGCLCHSAVILRIAGVKWSQIRRRIYYDVSYLYINVRYTLLSAHLGQSVTDLNQLSNPFNTVKYTYLTLVFVTDTRTKYDYNYYKSLPPEFLSSFLN